MQNIFFINIKIVIINYKLKVFKLIILSINNKLIFSLIINYNKVIFKLYKGIK